MKKQNIRSITVELPHGARAVLVSIDGSGKPVVQAIAGDQSVLDLRTELQAHLNEYPFSDEWLVELRDFVTAKLDARAAARKAQGFSVPLPEGRGFGVVRNFPLVQGSVEVRS